LNVKYNFNHTEFSMSKAKMEHPNKTSNEP
jgi:hypothetical protein